MKLRGFQPLDVSAGGLAAVLAAVIGVVMMLGSWIGISVQATGLDQEVGPYGPLTLTFSQPVDPDSILDRLSIQPEGSGRFEWADEKTLHFVPDTPLRAGASYQLTLSDGRIGANGEVLRKEQSWPVLVRTPKVVYLTVTNGLGQLWTVDTEGKSAQKLGPADKQIFDYAAAPDGDFLIFSAVNNSNGLDLWYLDRVGNAHILLNCGADHCITPAVSPDSLQVAYTLQTAPVSASVPMGAPRPWILNIQSGENRAIYADSQIIGYGPNWSPDGKYITS